MSLPPRLSINDANDTLNQPPPFLRIQAPIRACIFALAGVPQNAAFYLDSPWVGDHPRLSAGRPSIFMAERAALRPGLNLMMSLLLTCRSISSEVSSMFFSNNTFITKRTEPLMNLNPQSLSSMTDLHIILTPLRYFDTYKYSYFYPWNNSLGTRMEPELRRTILGTWRKLAPFLGQSVSRQHSIHFSLICDLTHLAPDEDDLDAAEQILRGLAHFPPLASCSIRLGEGRYPDMKILQHMSREAARKATVDQDFMIRPFRYLDLPLDIRLQILEYTDLVLPQELVYWSQDRRYSAWRGSRGEDKCRQINSNRKASVSDGFCSVFNGAFTPWCGCWHDPGALFLVSKTFLADVRHVFYSKNHILWTWKGVGNPDSWAGYPANDFSKSALDPSLWGVLRSIGIQTRRFEDQDKDASAAADWWLLIESLRKSEILNLRFLGLSIDNATLPGFKSLANMEKEQLIDAIRRIVHDQYWPLDAGEGSSLPLGTCLLEVGMFGFRNPGMIVVTAMYRLRALRQKPPSMTLLAALHGDRADGHNEKAEGPPTASRILLRGDPARHCRPEQYDGRSNLDTDWVEEVWFWEGQ